MMITTDRLHLRPHELGDLDALLAIYGDAEVMRFIGGQAISREELWNRLLRYHGHWTLLGFGLWAVEERHTGRLVGNVGFADFHRGFGDDFDGVPEAAWVIAGDLQGRGYASEAMAAALAWLDARGTTKSVCMIDPGNTASLRLASRFGYQAFATCQYRGTPIILHQRHAGDVPVAAR